MERGSSYFKLIILPIAMQDNHILVIVHPALPIFQIAIVHAFKPVSVFPCEDPSTFFLTVLEGAHVLANLIAQLAFSIELLIEEPALVDCRRVLL